jgi:alpha-D-xyloside xylohydrolase
VGAAKYGMILWSGDIHSRFEVLRTQVHGGAERVDGRRRLVDDRHRRLLRRRPDTPYFRELMVRWFQYGAFCPVFASTAGACHRRGHRKGRYRAV